MASLYAPEGYKRLSKAQKSAICNGCGSKGFGGWIVPDTIWGLSIEEACNIHDYMYHHGKTNAEKEAADRSMLNNMIRIIEQDGKQWWWLVRLRKIRAHNYYLSVKNFGGAAFWDNKQA